MRTAAVVLAAWGVAAAGAAEPVAPLRDDIRAFLERELGSHVAAIPTLDPPPDRVHGSPSNPSNQELGEELLGARFALGNDIGDELPGAGGGRLRPYDGVPDLRARRRSFRSAAYCSTSFLYSCLSSSSMLRTLHG